jgi:hypothetical protein
MYGQSTPLVRLLGDYFDSRSSDGEGEDMSLVAGIVERGLIVAVFTIPCAHLLRRWRSHQTVESLVKRAFELTPPWAAPVVVFATFIQVWVFSGQRLWNAAFVAATIALVARAAVNLTYSQFAIDTSDLRGDALRVWVKRAAKRPRQTHALTICVLPLIQLASILGWIALLYAGSKGLLADESGRRLALGIVTGVSYAQALVAAVPAGVLVSANEATDDLRLRALTACANMSIVPTILATVSASYGLQLPVLRVPTAPVGGTSAISVDIRFLLPFILICLVVSSAFASKRRMRMLDEVLDAKERLIDRWDKFTTTDSIEPGAISAVRIEIKDATAAMRSQLLVPADMLPRQLLAIAREAAEEYESSHRAGLSEPDRQSDTWQKIVRELEPSWLARRVRSQGKHARVRRRQRRGRLRQTIGVAILLFAHLLAVMDARWNDEAAQLARLAATIEPTGAAWADTETWPTNIDAMHRYVDHLSDTLEVALEPAERTATIGAAVLRCPASWFCWLTLRFGSKVRVYGPQTAVLIHKIIDAIARLPRRDAFWQHYFWLSSFYAQLGRIESAKGAINPVTQPELTRTGTSSQLRNLRDDRERLRSERAPVVRLLSPLLAPLIVAALEPLAHKITGS